MRREYWWIITHDEGRPYLIFGSAVSEDEARQKGLEMLPGADFEIKQYPTRDLSTASAYYRGARLNSGEGLTASTQRIGHEKSIKHLNKRKHYFWEDF